MENRPRGFFRSSRGEVKLRKKSAKRALFAPFGRLLLDARPLSWPFSSRERIFAGLFEDLPRCSSCGEKAKSARGKGRRRERVSGKGGGKVAFRKAAWGTAAYFVRPAGVLVGGGSPTERKKNQQAGIRARKLWGPIRAIWFLSFPPRRPITGFFSGGPSKVVRRRPKKKPRPKGEGFPVPPPRRAKKRTA